MFKVNARLKDTKEVARLIKSGADVNARIDDGYTALMYVAGRNATDVAMLIEAGADVNARDNDGGTPVRT